MGTYMHCRPFCGTYNSTSSSSFLSVRLGSITNATNQINTSLSYYHYDQRPPAAVARRRRRLEDPIATFASNYYITYPRQMSKSPSRRSTLLSSKPSSLSPSRQKSKQSNRKNIYCDLFNLLERPSSPTSSLIKQRKKHKSNDHNSCRYHRSIDLNNSHTKVKSTNDRKRHHQRYTYYKEKKCQDDKLSPIEQHDRSLEKTKKINHTYQPRLSNRGFFRRLVCNYFCFTSPVANNGYSS
ncbi:unnamed protein product [Rotaria sp. Silwood2]|nr:unnamed protein product [Rotaria sp. Silwood2]CAF2653230.1 unnamed protein product [Rotaria sp. Silwood2]CAF3064359.1 unnamed protein product [Rotaria sp. Silwood2]CAF4083175.1 unnamed protein product [Rotaria sp. Silwood2]CAF4198168.1 unnamed protein product [Rotaria sp. Silwood2]